MDKSVRGARCERQNRQEARAVRRSVRACTARELSPLLLFSMSRRAASALGGLPLSLARGRVSRRAKTPSTSHDELLHQLRRKSWQLNDLERHPVCYGVPLGQDGGPSKAVSVDCGLKNAASVSYTDLIENSPELKASFMDPNIADTTDLLRGAMPLPVSVVVKEDRVSQPIVAPMHSGALGRCVPDEKLRALTDPYFRANPPSSELVDLIVEAVPGADRSVAAKDDYKREQRAAMHSEQLATGGRR